MRLALCLTAALLLTAPALAQDPFADARPISWRDLLDRERQPADARIAYGQGEEQYGELWLPEGDGPFPLMIMIHGGCWQAAIPGTILQDQLNADLKARGIAFRSLTEQMDTTTPHGELLFSLFGALAQYERALTRERVMAGLAAAKRRGRQGGRPPMIDAETLERITAALDGGASKASVCRTFKVPRSTLLGTLARIGWTAPAKV